MHHNISSSSNQIEFYPQIDTDENEQTERRKFSKQLVAQQNHNKQYSFADPL